MTQTILVTGGLGYIGSHTVVKLLEQNYRVVILDNLCNSERGVHTRITQITGKDSIFVEGDIRDRSLIASIFQSYAIDGVIHFAGLKAVSESQAEPLRYFDNNVLGSISLIEAMQQNQVNAFVFSSSATVYGEPIYLPYDEMHPTKPINPYGHTKLQVETILEDWASSDPRVKVSILRYFNPVGAHESGLIGENPNQTPNNLMPYITRVISGELPHLNIYGNNYDTRDGTGERDYIHVMDLADGHLAALNHLEKNTGVYIHNLGTGHGTTVLELIYAFQKINKVEIPYQFSSRRDGDLPSYFANPNKALKDLGWQAKRSIEQSCKDTFRYLVSLDPLK